MANADCVNAAYSCSLNKRGLFIPMSIEMSTYQKYIACSRYARYLDDKGRRETWGETVRRYTDFMQDHLRDNFNYTNAALWRRLHSAILNLEVMPSMRALMTAGPALARDNICGYNCAYMPIDSPRAFDETMYILMCGTGVGYSVERQYVSKLPEVAEHFEDSGSVITVADSRSGWARAFKELLSMLYAGQVPKWDLSKLRPEGARLKTFGGRSSGPVPLDNLFKFTVNLFERAPGRKLTSIECHDLLCKIGEIVVAGGVRRSAMISLSNLSDDRMRHAKSGQWWELNGQRALANNSVAYADKPDVGAFMREWTALYDSKSGERGIFNRSAAKRKVNQSGRRDSNHDFGVNPCFSGDMKLLTARGYVTFKELASEDRVFVVNERGMFGVGGVLKSGEGMVWKSGAKPTVFINFHMRNRKSIQVTDNHRFKLNSAEVCEAKDLVGKRLMPYIEEAVNCNTTPSFLAGFILGDGALNRLNSKTHRGLEVYFSAKDTDIAKAWGRRAGRWYSRKAATIAETYELPAARIGERGLPESISSSFPALQGLYSANGCVIKTARVSLKTIDRVQADSLVKVLASYDIAAYITINKSKISPFNNGDYTCKESYDVNISRYDSLLLFSKLINFGQEYKRSALRKMLVARSPKVRSVTPGPTVDVYDFTEPLTHWGVVEGVIAHNCGEILLRPNQFCNLSEVVVRHADDVDTVRSRVELATILGTFQSTLTEFKYLRKVWRHNTEEERLLGVSLTGICDSPMMFEDTYGDFKTMLESLKRVAISTNKTLAKKLGIPQAAAITCVKPSGTVSQLVDSASGVHTRYAPYYIRTVRGDNKDPLTQLLIKAGVPNEPAIGSENTTTVFSFPHRSSPDSLVRGDVSALAQLRLWLTYQRHWCEHNPSTTIQVREHEWMDVGAFVYEHFDEVSGLSFIPYDTGTYRQAPYQEIGYEEYLEACELMPETIDFTALDEAEDNTTSSQELACSGGACEII